MYENFIGEGDKVVTELLQSKNFEIELIAALPHWIDQNKTILKPYLNVLYPVNNEQMEQLSTLKTPSEVLIIAKKKLGSINNLLNEDFKAFYLDGVQDPGNVGTIIRIADWYGMEAVIRSFDTADFFHPKVVQASMGSIAGISLCEMDYEQLATLKNLTIYAMDMDGRDLSKSSIKRPCIVILGNEGKGLSNGLKASFPLLKYLTIKGHQSRLAESLNVGVAAGIVAEKIFSS